MLKRRQFLITCFSAALAARLRAEGQPLKLGHRQASMTKQPGPGVFEIARQIPGITGVELQVQFQKTSLWDRDTLLSYKKGAADAGLTIPSLAGIWTPGAGLMQLGPAEEAIRKSIQAAEDLLARVILVVAFNKNCPNMQQEESYGPVVAMLQKVAPVAANAGVTLALETSQSPADDKKLIDLVANPAVKVYYDADNVSRFGYKDQIVEGYELLGKSRIAQIHMRAEGWLLEGPCRVDWIAAFKAIRKIGYVNWLVFETTHAGPEQCVEETRKNIEFIRRQFV